MRFYRHLKTSELRLNIDPPGHCSCNPQKHYLIPSYWGGPLFNIRGSANNPCTVPDADGRFVVYDEEPGVGALSSVAVPASWWVETVSTLEDLFLVDVATCDFCGNDVIFGAEKRLGSQNPANYSIMPRTEDNTALHFLADVALGYYLQPTYTFPAPTFQAPALSAPTLQAPTLQAPTLLASTIPAPSLSAPTPSAPTLPAHALPSTQGQNSGIRPTGSMAVSNPGLGTMSTQRSRTRTTGFNRTTGEGAYTSVCGLVTREISKPPNAKNKGAKAGFHCPRCNSQFTRPRSVKDHFITCVGKHGNPQGLSWWDHPTLQGAKDWHLKHMQETNEDDDEEDEDDEGAEGGDGEEGGAAGGDGEEGGQDHGEEEQDEEAESAPSFTPGEGSSRHGPTEGPSSRAPNEEYEEESFYDDDGDSIMS